jgi:hypothetical protein
MYAHMFTWACNSCAQVAVTDKQSVHAYAHEEEHVFMYVPIAHEALLL